MAKLMPIIKKASNPNPTKNLREKIDPANIFLPKAVAPEAAGPAPVGDSGMNLGRNRSTRSSYNYGSGLSGGVR